MCFQGKKNYMELQMRFYWKELLFEQKVGNKGDRIQDHSPGKFHGNFDHLQGREYLYLWVSWRMGVFKNWIPPSLDP